MVTPEGVWDGCIAVESTSHGIISSSCEDATDGAVETTYEA